MTKLFLRVMLIGLTLVVSACSVGAPVLTATPTPTSTPVPPTATMTPSPTLTPTPIPMASVKDAMDCYAGPSEQYDKVASLESGTEIQIVGQSDDGTFWIVMTEEESECWLTKESLTLITGETVALPHITSPATPTLSLPTVPSELTVRYACGMQVKRDYYGQKLILVLPTFYLNWKDNATNEDGYIVYKDGVEYKRIGPNSIEFSDTAGWAIQRYDGATELYAIAAFNSAGESERTFIYVHLKCPL